MPKSKTGSTELIDQVVQASRESLPFDEILRRVQAIMPITTKNPERTIRNAVSQVKRSRRMLGKKERTRLRS